MALDIIFQINNRDRNILVQTYIYILVETRRKFQKGIKCLREDHMRLTSHTLRNCKREGQLEESKTVSMCQSAFPHFNFIIRMFVNLGFSCDFGIAWCMYSIKIWLFYHLCYIYGY